MGTSPIDPLAALSEMASNASPEIQIQPDPKSSAGDAEETQEQIEADENLVKRLRKRINRAKKFKKRWEKDYEVNRSRDYIAGFQRQPDDERDAQGDKKYQINKILAAAKSKIPAIFYYHPYFRVRASQVREETPSETVQARADLLQNTVNTIIAQTSTRFKPECMLALKEAQWAFGVIEAGYTADWQDNPFAQKPQLVESDTEKKELEQSGDLVAKDDIKDALDADESEDQDTDAIDEILAKLPEVPAKEVFYVKHIPARQFLVSSHDKPATEEQDWVAYWEWMHVEDVKRCDAYTNTEDLEASAKLSSGSTVDDETFGDDALDEDEDAEPDMIRIWKIWDQRKKMRYVIADGHDRTLLKQEYPFLPLYDLRLEVLPGSWYPIPPISQQLTEQDEFNDAREWWRVVRKGTRPRYLVDKNAFAPAELEKLETDDFNTMVMVENGNMNGIMPVQQSAPSDASVRTLMMAEQGFSEQAASSPQARLTRGAGGTPTAAEVNALGQMTDVRESYEQQMVADWMANIASGLLLCAINYATLPIWIKMNSDPHSPESQLASEEIAKQYELITADQLEESNNLLSWDVTVDIESMSPVSEDQYTGKFMNALNMIANPGVGQLLSLSPVLLKLVLNMIGVKNTSDQAAILGALQARDQMLQQQAAMNAPSQPGVSPMPGGGGPPGGGGGGGGGGDMPAPPDAQQQGGGGPQGGPPPQQAPAPPPQSE